MTSQLSGNIFGIVRHHFWDLRQIFMVQKEANTRVTGVVSGHFKVFRCASISSSDDQDSLTDREIRNQ